MEQKGKPRSEIEGIIHFFREMGSALVMALVFIVYIVQAFKIPTPSMEKSLLVGDFLLGLKFVYGAPLVPFALDLGISKRFPAIQNPKPGDVVIFKYPGSERKDYIKRCIAGPGSVVEIIGEKVIVDGKELIKPPESYYMHHGQIGEYLSHFKPLRIPAKGDLIRPVDLPTREFLFCKNLIKQENPRAKVKAVYQLYIDGNFSNNEILSVTDPFTGRRYEIPFHSINFDTDNWIELEHKLNSIKEAFEGHEVEVKKFIYINDKPIEEYIVKYDNYFMMGDNRDNSADSRFWGYLNRNYVKAKAFILYFSLDKNVPIWQLPLKIRWNRIGKLIKSWDGMPKDKNKSKS